MSSTLTPAQRELLSLFRRDLPEAEWEEVRRLIARYFAQRTTDAADRAWDANDWSDDDIDRLLHDRS